MQTYKSQNKQIPSLDRTAEEIASNTEPIGNTESQEILRDDRDLTPKDWCHCATKSDWCGEGCYQPQNKESVLAMDKGGCNNA